MFDPRWDFCLHESVLFFFFQAEDGIRDWSVTGVQTCALPICHEHLAIAVVAGNPAHGNRKVLMALNTGYRKYGQCGLEVADWWRHVGACADRSEERRVGKESGGRWARGD